MTYVKENNDVKEAVNVNIAIKEFCEAWGLSEGAAERMIEDFNDTLPDWFQEEGIDPYKEFEENESN